MDSDRVEAKAVATRSKAAAIAAGDNVVEMIGQVMSVVTLGFAAKNGDKVIFLLTQGSEQPCRQITIKLHDSCVSALRIGAERGSPSQPSRPTIESERSSP